MRLVWDTALPWLVIAALGAGAAALLFRSYRSPRRPIPARTRACLFALRVGVLGILLFLLARPILEGKEGLSDENRIVFLLDSSRSMTLQDEGTLTRFQAVREAWSRSRGAIEELGKLYRLSVYRFGSELREVRDLSFEPTDERTWIGSAIAEALARADAGTLEHVVLVSDGQNNGGRDPQGQAYALERKGTRLHTVSVGKPAGAAVAANVIARGARGPEEVLAGKVFEVFADFQVLGAAGEELVVDFGIDGRVLSTARVAVRQKDEFHALSFQHMIPEEGNFVLTFSARPVKGEAVTDDNTAFLPVKVRKKILEVIYVEGQVRDEFKYLRRSLSRFDDLKLTTVLVLTPEPGQEAMPLDEAGWLKYDVVVLGDLPARSLTAVQTAGLEGAVRKGLGFVMIGGYENFGAGGYAGTPVADLLPVRIAAGENRTEETYTLEPTEEGNRSSVLRLSPDPQKNRELWQSLPRLKGFSVAEEKKRGETVLARGPSGLAILSAQEYGSGRSAAFLADTTWRWWRSAGGREDLHKRFWRQMVLWLAHREGKGEGQVRIRAEKTLFEPGEVVRLRVEVKDELRNPVEGAQVQATVEGPDGKRLSLRMEPEPEGYGATFTPQAPGKHRVQAGAEKDKVTLGRDEADLVVHAQDRELRAPYANLELLKGLARAARGEGTDLKGFPGLLSKIQAEHRPVVVHQSVTRELWTSPWVLLLFGLFLVGEWLLRRWIGIF